MCRWVGVVLALLLGGLTTSLAAPAWACGCGAYIPDQRGASVVDERALVAWDGSREDILMSLRVTGSSDSAAWVMPVPSAAQVSLGESEAFDELGTAHRSAHRVPRLVVADVQLADRGRTVRGRHGRRPAWSRRQRPRPAADRPLRCDTAGRQDPAALAKWLTDNGFPHPDGLDANLAPYVADGWEIVAVKLAPAATGESLTGDLQPLRLSFASDEVVYPMRLSRSASSPQTVDLFVLADHRMDPTSIPVADNTPTLEFAGPIEGSGVSPALADFVGDGAFLTRWNNNLLEPASIDGDYIFEPAVDDTTYQRVIYRERNRGDLTGLTLIALVGAGGIAVTVSMFKGCAQAR